MPVRAYVDQIARTIQRRVEFGDVAERPEAE